MATFDFLFFFLVLYQTNFFFLKQLDALIGSMNTKGERERALKKQLEKFYNKIWSANLSLPIIDICISRMKFNAGTGISSSCNCSYLWSSIYNLNLMVKIHHLQPCLEKCNF